MKKIVLILLVLICSSFSTGWPCHPYGDIGPCTHRLHPNDVGPCTHTDWQGYRVHDYDYYPCTHRTHPRGDLYPCTHYCN